ncbi:MAG TPA: prolyl oligopeptidase family serine peptidase [Acidobacteriota bacterium]|nr:prolyl oligopeptidase family serine peptidase [Acidobacteriota bacterium]
MNAAHARLALAMPLLVAAASPHTPAARTPVLQRAAIQELDLALDDGTELHYAVAVPPDIVAGESLPLVVGLHFGWRGEQSSRLGRDFLRIMLEPGLSDTRAILVAPNCPEGSWNHPRAEAAVLDLVDALVREHPVDTDRILVTGFSLGGMGTWFFAANHAEVFDAAIAIASVPVIDHGNRSRDDPDAFLAAVAEGTAPWVRALMRIPFFVINSRADELIPFAHAEAATGALVESGAPLQFLSLDGISHYESARYVPALQQGVRWVLQQWGAASGSGR